MRRLLLPGAALLGLLLPGCGGLLLGPDPDAKSPTAVYDAFWRAYDQDYNAFAARRVNWDSLYAVYRPQVTDQLTGPQLLAVIGQTIRPLHDGHVAVVATGAVGTATSYDSPRQVDFPGLDLIQRRYAPDYLRVGSASLGYAAIRPGVGYLYVGTFANDPGFARLDQALDQMQDYKAIIVDVRDNTGGNDANGSYLAGRFTAGSVLYGYTQYRNGPARTDFSAPDPLRLPSRGGRAFTRPVYLLTNRYVFSAGNSFVLMMRALPNVVQIGETTGDGVAGPTFRELGNGWVCAVPDKLTTRPDGRPVDGLGIAPNLRVRNEAGSPDEDRILEAALMLAAGP